MDKGPVFKKNIGLEIKFIMEFNNREIAAIIWIAILVFVASFKLEIRSSLISVVGAFFQRTIIISVTLAVLWISLCVWLLSENGLWVFGNLKTTLLWGGGFCFRYNDGYKQN